MEKIRDKMFQNEIASIMVIHICVMQCKNMLVSTNNFLYQINERINLILTIFFGGLYIYFFVKNRIYKRLNAKVFSMMIVIGFWWFISFLGDNNLFISTNFPYNYVRRQALTFIAYSLPLFFISSYLSDASIFLDKLYKATNIVFVVGLLAFVFYLAEFWGGGARRYSMSYGNQMLLAAALLVFKFIDTNKYRYMIMFFLTVIFILVAGSRGPLVSIIFLLIYTIVGMKKNKVNIFFITFSTILSIFILFFFDEFMVDIYMSLEKIGITSRTITMLKNGMGMYSSSRNYFHETLLNAINQSPIIGLGAFGGEKTVGLAHSLYLDIFANFGYIFGVLFIILLLGGIIKCLKKDFYGARAKLILLFSILLFPRGFFDETFWASWYLWLIMGLLISSNKGYSLIEVRCNMDKEKTYME